MEKIEKKLNEKIEKQKTINEIFIRRKDKLIFNYSSCELPLEYLATILKNLESLGYTLSKEVQLVLKTYCISEITSFHNDLMPILAKQIWNHSTFIPITRGF